MERKTSRTISRKIRGLRKLRASRKVKQRKIAATRVVQQGHTIVHPRQNPLTAVPGPTGTRAPGAQSTVRPDTAVPAQTAAQFRDFSTIYLRSLAVSRQGCFLDRFREIIRV